MTNESGDTSERDAAAVEELDPKIAHHGAYIEETKRLLRTYVDCESYAELKHRVVEENLLNKDTDYYRKNILREVTRRYIPDTESYTVTPLMRVLTADVREDVVDWCLYYEFARDPFIRLVTEQYLYPEFERGALTVQAEDIVTFLESIQDDYTGLGDRTPTTIEEAATKYLAALKNFGLLDGSQRKEFAVTYIPDETIAYVIYRLFEQDVTTATSVINHDDWTLFLMDAAEVRRRIQDISPTYVTYEKRGSTERLVADYETPEALINAF